MRRKIIWEYWQNPLGGGTEYVNEDEMVEVDDFNPDDSDGIVSVTVRPFIPTPMGLMPINPYGPGSINGHVDMWMMHTNFDIDENVARILDRQVHGIEFLDIVTSYRARIGFGKAFDSTTVKVAIQNALNARPPERGQINPLGVALDSDTEWKVEQAKKSAKGVYWAIYVVPNGKVALESTNDRDKYEESVDLFRQAQENAGGVIYISHECSEDQ